MPKIIKILLAGLLFITCSICLQAQVKNSAHGGPFTPHGDIRFLIIFAGFESQCDPSHPLYNHSSWPQIDSKSEPCKTIPAFFDSFFYKSYEQFSPDNTDRTLSNFFYQMSRKSPHYPPLRIVADYFPERINIKGHSHDNREVFKIINEKYPDFDWSKYDNRKNRPDFLFDNSLTGPDQQLDYVVVVWREDGQSGYASINTQYTFTTTVNGKEEKYRINSGDGFTIVKSMGGEQGVKGLFLHEFAHSLYNCPHLYSAQDVLGNYFYGTNGWGMMAFDKINTSANAWESWYCGWIELDSIKDLRSYKQNGYYVLKDFASTGDAIRIKLPFNQYLWLENHSGKTIFDSRSSWLKDGDGNPIPPASLGLYMYIENIADSRDKIISPLSLKYANGLKALDAGGNFDFMEISSSLEKKMWGNWVVNFKRERENPCGGQCNISLIRGNYSHDELYPDTIIHRTYTNGRSEGCRMCKVRCKEGIRNEFVTLVKVEDSVEFGMCGRTIAFGNGKLPHKTGISSNPMIINHQRYDECEELLEPVYLHGVSVTVISKTEEGDLVLEIRFDDTDIYQDHRLTGNVVISNVENAKYDINILPGVTLTIDKSGTPNRHTKGKFINGAYEFPDFIRPSSLTIEKGATMNVEKGATLNVKEGSTLVLKSGSRVIIRGKVRVAADSYLAIEPGAEIVAEGKKSAIEIRRKTRIGINAKSGVSGVNYITQDLQKMKVKRKVF
ncbi:MAG TPA: hypothetical protein VIK89_05215 [Cytophagaceae bacterium]